MNLEEMGNHISRLVDELQTHILKSLKRWFRRRGNRKKFYEILHTLLQVVMDYESHLEDKDLDELDIDEQDLVRGLADYDLLQAYALVSLLSRNLVGDFFLPDYETILNLFFRLDYLLEKHNELIEAMRQVSGRKAPHPVSTGEEEVLVDKDGYPTQVALDRLTKLVSKTDWKLERVKEFVDYLKEIWWEADWGIEFKFDGNKWELWLHTGGWSGNEEIMRVISKSMFWAVYWKVQKRGGHYYFSNTDD